MKKEYKFLAVGLSAIMLSTVFTGCGSPAKDLIGKWTNENLSGAFEFYEDGKCEVPDFAGGGYGEESYVVDSNNMLKLTSFYGETETFTFVSPDKADEFTKDNPEELWWYLDGDKLYINSAENYYTKK